ncbi:hypothetical protein OF846_005216 [Rhodotorula toruloides]|nr:hypothetical protein OF846_005216 [Rhodotorula toruloides]
MSADFLNKREPSEAGYSRELSGGKGDDGAAAERESEPASDELCELRESRELRGRGQVTGDPLSRPLAAHVSLQMSCRVAESMHVAGKIGRSRKGFGAEGDAMVIRLIGREGL